MITKSKFIKGLWFIEVAIEANTFYIDNLEDTLGEFITSTLDCKGPALIIQREEDRNCISYYSPDTFYCLQKNNIKNPKGLFLTKLATEEDWKELRKLIDIQTEKADKFICESLLYKQEGLDNEKNYLIIKEDG